MTKSMMSLVFVDALVLFLPVAVVSVMLIVPLRFG